MYVDAWTVDLPEESPILGAEQHEGLAPFAGESLFGMREFDLADLAEDAQDAVLLAGTVLLTYLEERRRLPEA